MLGLGAVPPTATPLTDIYLTDGRVLQRRAVGPRRVELLLGRIRIVVSCHGPVLPYEELIHQGAVVLYLAEASTEERADFAEREQRAEESPTRE